MAKPTSIRLDDDVEAFLPKFMEDNNIKTTNKAINTLLQQAITLNQELPQKDRIKLLARDFELDNLIQMRAFLTMKQWEARESNGHTLIKTDELIRIEEFMAAFSDLVHNVNPWREVLAKEGYKGMAESINAAREFM